MVVLMIGGSGVFMNAVIDKLNKNGHRVYLLTGQAEKRGNYSRVFERYDFPYDTGSMKDILESVAPDVVLFTGAYDTNFDWESPRQETVRYMAGLMNILSTYSMMPKKGRFLYLSSQEVFGDAYFDYIKEETPKSPRSLRAMALAQGEEACASYRQMQGMDTVVVRFGNLYWTPEKGGMEDNPCFRMCLEALEKGRISVNTRRSFSMIYINDAVEELYKLILAEDTKRGSYHVSSMEELGEAELAEKVRGAIGQDIEIVDSTVGTGGRLLLDGSRYAAEFGQEIFNSYDAGVQRVASYMKRHSASFLLGEDTGGGLAARFLTNAGRTLKVLFPFIENLVFFIPVFMLYNRTAGSAFFARLDLYLLFVLLFAVVHGQQQAVFSGFLAVAGYCFRQMYERSGFEVLLDCNTYVWAAQLFIVGLAVGYMRDHLRDVKNEDDSRMRYLQEKLKDIEDINDSNVRIKQNFEAQVINHSDSLGKVYEASSALEQYEPEEVLFYAAQVLSNLMDSRDVAIYTVANGDYARLFSATSPEARRLGNSIRYSGMKGMYEELRMRRTYINRDMDKDMPMMATAVYSEDEMQLILMLWGIPWERMTLGEANRLTIIGRLIQNAAVRANRYLEALRNRRYVQGTRVLDEAAFTQLEKAFRDAREKKLTEYVLLEILAQEQDYETVSDTLGSAIRQTDYLGLLNGGRLYVLLANTGMENVDGVIARFQQTGYACRLEEAV